MAQAGRYILESNTPLFTPNHVGGRFCLIHAVEANYQAGTLGYEAVSGGISSGGDWTLRTWGTWTGTLTLEISRDGGDTWQTHQVWTRGEEDDNFYVVGNLNEAENKMQFRLRSGQNTGDCQLYQCYTSGGGTGACVRQ